MRFSSSLLLSAMLGSMASIVAGVGSSCDAPMSGGTAGADDPFWMETIEHNGISAFNADPSGYKVFKNVKDFGAKGDGTTDDTAAINEAMADGGRCGGGECESSTVTPAIVYFPAGTYLVSKAITPYYYTQVIGDARNPPTIQASADFTGFAIIDVDPYIDGGDGAQWFTNQNNFFRSIRNFVIDTTKMPASATGTGIHWQVAQATSLMNIHFEMSTEADNAHQGIWSENGSGGFMGDLSFNGGKYGMWVGNQQFTVRNVTITNAETAIFSAWNWGWTYQNIKISDCGVAFDAMMGGLTEDTQTTGALAILDAEITNTPIFIRTDSSTDSLAGAIILKNIVLDGVDTGVVAEDKVLLEGGSKTVAGWIQGNVYSGTDGTAKFTQGEVEMADIPEVLLEDGKVYGKGHPQYADYAADQFVSVKSEGAKGDGETDDTAALQAVFDKYSGCKIIYFDAGTYIVTDTLTIPAGTQMTGEAWTVLAAKGAAFQDAANPKVAFRVGEADSKGILEISDILFSTIGGAGGAIIVEWNVAAPDDNKGGAGLWDSHIRVGGSAKTGLEGDTCSSDGGSIDDCYGGFLSLHLTKGSTAYHEATWVWTADHDLDGDGLESQISVYTGRGILDESQGPVWMFGGASEHHTIYQYNLVGAKNHFMGLIQTESPYYQPAPAWPEPFALNADFSDPDAADAVTSSWAFRSVGSTDIFIFGAGFYSFFDDYTQECLDTFDCQDQLVNIDSDSSISLYSMSTVATTNSLSIDGKAVIKQADNRNGFASHVAAWTK